MHIAFDTLAENPHAPSSAINFFMAFAETLKRVREREDHWSVLVSPANRHLFEGARADAVDLVECAVSNEQIVRRIAYQQTRLPRRLRQIGADVVLGYNVVPLSASCARVVKISTLHHYEIPEGLARNPFRLYYRRFMFAAACRRAEAVIANSRHTREAILRYMHVPGDKVHIVHEAVSEEFQPPADPAELGRRLRATWGIESGYVLFASTIWRYKNLDTLITAMSRLSGPFRRLALMVAGKNGDAAYYGEVQALIARLGLTERVRLLGEIPNDQLVALFQGAGVFVNPSRSETYGKPVVEAMRCHVPVVAARAGSLPDIAGSAAEFVDPGDPEAMAHSIERLLGDRERRQQLIAAGTVRARDFSWEATVRGSRAVCAVALERFRARRH